MVEQIPYMHGVSPNIPQAIRDILYFCDLFLPCFCVGSTYMEWNLLYTVHLYAHHVWVHDPTYKTSLAL